MFLGQDDYIEYVIVNMIGLFLVLIVLSIIGWVLVSPFRIIINSRQNDYGIYWKGIGQATLSVEQSKLWIDLRFTIWRKKIDVLHLFSMKTGARKAERKSGNKNSKKIYRRFFKLIGSFRLQYLFLSLDTDDYILNSYLLPLFHLLQGKNRTLLISYQGRTELSLIIENRLYRLLVRSLTL